MGVGGENSYTVPGGDSYFPHSTGSQFELEREAKEREIETVRERRREE